MSSPATIPRAFINMPSSPIIDLTISPMSVRTQAVRTQAVEVVFISDTEDEINDPPHNRNNNNYHLNDNNNDHNSTLGFDNQNIFNSSRHSSNNNQDSSNSNNNYNLRSGLAGLGTNSPNGGGPIRNTSTRSSRAQSRPSAFRGLLNLMLNVTVSSSQANNNSHRQHHTSAFHPYEIHYGNNSSGSSRTIPPMASFFESTRTNTNINNNDIQIVNTPPPSSSRRRANNSPKPTTLVGHARDLNDSHTLVCADCNELLHEKLWALGSCGHVVCGSCVDKYSEKKKFHCPSCKKMTKPTTLLQLYV